MRKLTQTLRGNSRLYTGDSCSRLFVVDIFPVEAQTLPFQSSTRGFAENFTRGHEIGELACFGHGCCNWFAQGRAESRTDKLTTNRATTSLRHSTLYLGTAVTAGRAEAVVVSTGTATELGKIGRLVATSTKERSPVEIQLAQLGRRLVYPVLAIAAIVMVTGWLRRDGLWLIVEVAISLAVAAVPEGLPAVTTLILALGVLRMAQQRAIMRRLPAVETLGSTTVICA